MKKNLTKKALLPAIAMVIASVIALSGVTYAWFTTGTTATIGAMDVNVQTAKGIQVSLDAASWKSVITATDIQTVMNDTNSAYANRVIQFPAGEIAPVSSAGNLTDGKLDMFLGGYNGDGTLFSTAQTDTNGDGGNYIAFDLFFKTGIKQKLSLKRGTEATKESYVIGKSIDGSSATAATETAVRVAIINLGNAKEAKDARSLKGEGMTGNVNIWEPNSTKRAPDSTGTADTKLDYSGFAKAFESAPENNLGSNASVVTTFDSDKELFTLEEGITKVRIYI